MSAPVIGLSTYTEPARWAAWQAPAALLPTSYIDQVTEAGGVPLLLPPVPGIARALGRRSQPPGLPGASRASEWRWNGPPLPRYSTFVRRGRSPKVR